MTKPTAPQAKFMTTILKHGGDRVPGTKVFGKREHPVVVKPRTIESCKTNGWVVREEDNGQALWTLTASGRTALAEATAGQGT